MEAILVTRSPCAETRSDHIPALVVKGTLDAELPEHAQVGFNQFVCCGLLLLSCCHHALLENY